MAENRRNIVVMGGSSGAIEALRQLVGNLESELAAALAVVVHTSEESPRVLDEILGRAGPLWAKYAVDGEPFRNGRIHLASPGYHLLMADSKVLLTRGPQENFSRPAIDPLFRSAAVAKRSRVIGVLLSGNLDDGVSGLAAIKQCGGMTVVQDPADALVPDMPRNAVAAGFEIDHLLPAAEIGKKLNQLVFTPAPEPPAVPEPIRLEAALAGGWANPEAEIGRLGQPSMLACPECGGGLHELHDQTGRRYRCHLGHAYTEKNLLVGIDREAEHSLMAAVRKFEEQRRIYVRLAAEHKNKGKMSEIYQRRQAEAGEHAQNLRRLLANLHREQLPPAAGPTPES